MDTIKNKKDMRGFASMNQEKQRRIAKLGGQAAHFQGKAHRFTSDEAKIAGRKGWEARLRNIRARKAQKDNADA